MAPCRMLRYPGRELDGLDGRRDPSGQAESTSTTFQGGRFVGADTRPSGRACRCPGLSWLAMFLRDSGQVRVKFLRLLQ